MSVGACGPFEAVDVEVAESAFDTLAAECEALRFENRLLKLEVRTLLDTIKCAGDVLEKLIEESKRKKAEEKKKAKEADSHEENERDIKGDH